MSARAIASFCMFPRDSLPTLARSYSRRLKSSKNLSAASHTSFTPRRAAMYSKFSLTESVLYGVASSGRYPRIDLASELNGSCALILIVPVSGFKRPTRSVRDVDLPAPFGPRRAYLSPHGILNETSSRATDLPSAFVTNFIDMYTSQHDSS